MDVDAIFRVKPYWIQNEIVRFWALVPGVDSQRFSVKNTSQVDVDCSRATHIHWDDMLGPAEVEGCQGLKFLYTPISTLLLLDYKLPYFT